MPFYSKLHCRDILQSNKGFEKCEPSLCSTDSRLIFTHKKSGITSSTRLAKYDLTAKMPLIVDNAFTNRASVCLPFCCISTMTTSPHKTWSFHINTGSLWSSCHSGEKQSREFSKRTGADCKVMGCRIVMGRKTSSELRDLQCRSVNITKQEWGVFKCL